jgi:hypothetical protein
MADSCVDVIDVHRTCRGEAGGGANRRGTALRRIPHRRRNSPAVPAAAQIPPEDMAVDCVRGPNILRLCRVDCKAELYRKFSRGVNVKQIDEEVRQCSNECEAIAVALEECKSNATVRNK